MNILIRIMDFLCLKEDFVEYLNSENDFSTLNNINITDVNSRSSHKCGEIFISEEEVFNFLCTLCEAPFEEVDKFFVHVKSIHKNTYGQKDLDPLEQNETEYECEKIKSEFQYSIEQNSIDKLNSISTENVSNPCDDDILMEELLSENRDEENEKSSSVSDIDENEIWHTTKKNVQNKETIIKFRSNNLNEHKQEFSAEKNTDVLCDISKDFTRLYNLERHVNNIHSIVRASNNSSIETEPQSQSIPVLIQPKSTDSKNIKEDNKNNSLYSEKTSHRCKYCGRQFKEKSKLEEHETISCGDKPSECQTCGKQFPNKKRLWEHKKVHTNIRKYKCQICQSTFKCHSNLYSHMLRHGEKKYSCNHCNKTFYTGSEKKEHETVHTGKKPFVCITCGKSFAKKSRLLQHEVVHIDIREHKCDICQSAFKDKSGLNAHILRHGEKKYSCSYCEKRFFVESEKRNHETVHTGEELHTDKELHTGKKLHTGSGNFVCTTCGKRCITIWSLRTHEAIHTDIREHKCDICQSAFKDKAGLKSHMRRHSEKKYSCSHCAKRFFGESEKRNHETVHTDEKPFVCNCGNRFKTQASMRKHMKKFH